MRRSRRSRPQASPQVTWNPLEPWRSEKSSAVKSSACPVTWRGQDFKRVSVGGIKLAAVVDGIPHQLPVTVAAWRFWAVSPGSFDIIDG
jgi:hypothetical protein